MGLKPDFDPDLSVCDITENFKTRFNRLKIQNRCPSSRENCDGTFLAVIEAGLPKCRQLLDEDTIMDKGQENAFTCYTEAKKLCPNHADVQKGFEDMEKKYIKWINKKIEQKKKKRANEFLDRLKKVNPESSAIRGLEQRLSKI